MTIPRAKKEPQSKGDLGLTDQFLAAIRKAGATEFCPRCYAYVVVEHACPTWGRATGA